MKKILVAILAILVLLTAVMTGCSASETTAPAATSAATATTATVASPFSQDELQQMVAGATAAGKASTTYKYVMSMDMKVTIDGEQSPGDINIDMEGAIDAAGQAMIMSMDMTVPDDAGGTQSQQMDMYLLEGSMYIKMDFPGMGEQWIKTAASEEIMNTFNADVMNEQWDAFSAPGSIEYVKEESVRGVDCYVLKVTPNADYLRQYAEENAGQGIEIDWDKVEDVNDLYENLDYRIWIAKDSEIVLKTAIGGIMEYNDSFAHSDEVSFDTMTMGIDVVMEMYDHGMAVNIELPAEAENAMEISPEAFLGQ